MPIPGKGSLSSVAGLAADGIALGSGSSKCNGFLMWVGSEKIRKRKTVEIRRKWDDGPIVFLPRFCSPTFCFLTEQ